MTGPIKITTGTRILAMFFLVTFLAEILTPTIAYALTGGPSQPEVQSFEPVGTTQMVDPFSGDFVYNIPLMDVDGYPLNISYHSGVSMDQEASWVGLGWNLNVGTINRGMRGLPDDFKGSEDKVTKELNINHNWTLGFNSSKSIELAGFPSVKPSFGTGFGIFYNNYRGVGYELNTSASVKLGDRVSVTPGIGLTANSQEGISLEPSLSLGLKTNKQEDKDVKVCAGISANVGATFNTRKGLQQLSMHRNASLTVMKSTRGNNHSGSIPIGDQSYVPQINMPMNNFSISGSFAFGWEFKWGAIMKRLSVYYHNQHLDKNSITEPAYGYMYADEANDDKDALHDINREKDGEYTKHTPALPLTNFTYDIYSVSGQGVGGMYRPFRNDKGVVCDPNVETSSKGGNIGADVTVADIVKLGLSGGTNFTSAHSGKWKGGSGSAQGVLGFKGKSKNRPEVEPYYFKEAGEMTAIDQSYYNEMGNSDKNIDEPVSIDVTDGGDAKAVFTNNVEIKNGQNIKRVKRNQAISVFTAEEAKYAALEKKIKSYTINADGDQIPEGSGNDPGEERDSGLRKKNHISEITTYRTDGARYVYGIPAYNNIQQEVTFNVGSNSVDLNTGLVNYAGGTDNSTSNKLGFDHYFSSTELPAYAHSYLLTAVLSADYVDRLGDGPTDDDFGTYTKFNYNKHSSSYKWRVPYEKNAARFNEGLKTQSSDNKGSYVYGEKEIWYLKSVVTKSMVAEFTLSDREDGHGVVDKNGGPSNDAQNTLQKLDKITLYSKCDRTENGSNAVPLQEVHFVYDYDLCKGIPNSISGNGKLTLKQIYFTYQKSLKGKLSPYRFNYCYKEGKDAEHDNQMEIDHNPRYSLNGYDRWGNYKKDNPAHPNSDFPYVDQQTDDASRKKSDQNASAWSLTQIQLPSGGNIDVSYESDDYSFVQDKKSMQMMEVIGLGSTEAMIKSASTTNTLYENDVPHTPNNFLKVKLPVPVTSDQEFREKYLADPFASGSKEMKTIYFRFLVDIIGDQGGFLKTGNRPEFVSGYAELTGNSGSCKPAGIPSNEAWVELKSVKIDFMGNDKSSANPIARTAWQMARIYLSNEMYPGSSKDPDDNGTNVPQLAKSLIGFIADMKSMAGGVNRALRRWEFGKVTTLTNGQSIVRLYSPEFTKRGGGCRVKKLMMSDNWSGMANDGVSQNASYGQEFNYTKVLEGSNGQVISSGVAEYEPMIGNDENPLHQPVAFTNEHWMIPDDRFYQETPYGESFYPNPSIGYSQVTVRSLQSPDIKRTATGKIVHEFYTARDFPVVTEQTTMQRKSDKSSRIAELFSFRQHDYETVSQGFLVKLNNMHGKQKATSVYAEGQKDPISYQKFFYKTDKDNNQSLNSKVLAIGKDGTVRNEVVGKEADFIADMRQNSSENWVKQGALEVDISKIIVPPLVIVIPIPSFFPDFSKQTKEFKSAVVTKVITTYGILEKVVSYDLGSQVTAENLAYDAETGEVLLTKVNNNFDDPVYSFTYPAHWAYDRMGMAYRNLGMQIEIKGVENGMVTLKHKSHSKYFVAGDEVINSKNHERYWVNSVDKGNIELINRYNEQDDKVNISGESILAIVKSGRKNMQATPVGSITLLDNPIVEEDGQKKLSFTRILNASATEFSDRWTDYCECDIDNGSWQDDPSDDPIDYASNSAGQKFFPKGNLYTQGAAGIWKAKRNNVFLTEREHSDLNRNSDIRKDGTYRNFAPFWKPNSGRDWRKFRSNWAWTSEVTKMSPYGFELENKDTLNHFSSAVYGYSNTLPVAVVQNARYKEVGVDNFEDHNCTNCVDDHWSFKVRQNVSKITTDQAHTGKKSMELQPHTKTKLGKKIICKPDINIPPV